MGTKKTYVDTWIFQKSNVVGDNIVFRLNISFAD